MSDDVIFFNMYVKVLKSKFDRALSDAMNLEAQLIIANEKIDSQQKEIENLQKNINKIDKKGSTKTT
jgi:hypothetical protein